MKKVKLGEVCEILSGYAFKSSQFNDKKIGLPLIRIRDVERGFSDTYFEGAYPEEYLIKNGDLLITMDGSFILKKWEGDLALLNQRVCKIKITDKSVDEGYLAWLIPKFLKEIEDKTPFVTVKHLSVAKIKDISFVLPNKLEQKLISKRLNTISQIYDFRKIQSEGLNELVKSRFNEMFGDPVLNEMGWEKHRLSKLTLKIGSGATPRGGRESYVNEGIALIRSMNVYDGKFIFKDLAYLTNVQAEKLNNVIVESDDVLLNITGASVSRCCIVPQIILPARVNQHVSIIRCKKHLLSPIFLNQLLITSEFKSLLQKIGESSGATRQAITKNQIEELTIPLPPLSLQNEFADFVAQVDKSQLAIQKSLEELETLKKSLMQEYFG
ncbi:restriction endonuclease subunit S [Streptococcus infantis]|uniref:Type I restriction modification DNA specificity domain protein n=1 Tax=Streptococcus infantis X TaxID=997830 RepID=F9PBR9_9STRE|nr:type I restriction modification DNA specificity domain protein [Streptococcus infantis X]